MSDPIDPGAGPSSPVSPATPASDSISAGSPPEENLKAEAGHGKAGTSPWPESSSQSPASHLSSTVAPATPGSSISSPSRPPDDSEAAGDTSSLFDTDDTEDDYPDSMTSAVQQYVYEGGLRYHAFRNGKYAFPNDDVEQNRDDMKHTMTLMLCQGRHFYAPVEERLRQGGKCLDLGGCPFSTSAPRGGWRRDGRGEGRTEVAVRTRKRGLQRRLL